MGYSVGCGDNFAGGMGIIEVADVVGLRQSNSWCNYEANEKATETPGCNVGRDSKGDSVEVGIQAGATRKRC